jgi:hypothetical protein
LLLAYVEDNEEKDVIVALKVSLTEKGFDGKCSTYVSDE